MFPDSPCWRRLPAVEIPTWATIDGPVEMNHPVGFIHDKFQQPCSDRTWICRVEICDISHGEWPYKRASSTKTANSGLSEVSASRAMYVPHPNKNCSDCLCCKPSLIDVVVRRAGETNAQKPASASFAGSTCIFAVAKTWRGKYAHQQTK